MGFDRESAKREAARQGLAGSADEFLDKAFDRFEQGESGGYTDEELDLLCADLKAKTGVEVSREDMSRVSVLVAPGMVDRLRRERDDRP